MPLQPCSKCFESRWKMEFPDASTIRATCERCGHEVEFAAKKRGPGEGHSITKVRISEVGNPCRHCQTPVARKEHGKPPKYKAGGYYYLWWLKCPKCKAIYHQEIAMRFFDQPEHRTMDAPKVHPPFVPGFTREEIESQTGDPPW